MAAKHKEGLSIVVPNAFLSGLSNDEQKEAKIAFVNAAIEAAKEIEQDSGKYSGFCGIFVNTGNTQDLNKLISDSGIKSIAINYGDLSAPSRVSKEGKFAEEITFEQQKILAEINKYFSEYIKNALPNYNRNIPNNDEYKLIIEKLSEVKEMQDFAQEPSNQQENTIRETEAQIDENSEDKFFDAENYNKSRATIRESDTDEEFKDVNESIFLEENNTQLVPERLHSETSVVATDQTNGIQNNNQQPGNLNNDASRSVKFFQQSILINIIKTSRNISI